MGLLIMGHLSWHTLRWGHRYRRTYFYLFGHPVRMCRGCLLEAYRKDGRDGR